MRRRAPRKAQCFAFAGRFVAGRRRVQGVAAAELTPISPPLLFSSPAYPPPIEDGGNSEESVIIGRRLAEITKRPTGTEGTARVGPRGPAEEAYEEKTNYEIISNDVGWPDGYVE